MCGEGHWAETERQEGWGEAVSPNTGRAEEGRLGKHFRWKGLGVWLEKEASRWYPSVRHGSLENKNTTHRSGNKENPGL